MNDPLKSKYLILCLFAIFFAVLIAPSVSAQAPAVQEAQPSRPKINKTPRIRTGTVKNTLFTTEKPASEGSSAISRPSSAAWAVITVALDANRALSVFDYALRKDGTEYKCLDIAEGSEGSFRGTIRNYRSTESGKIWRMVFAVPSEKDEYELIFKLIPGEEDPVKVNVKEPDPPPVTANSTTLQEALRLVGAERTPHKDLSAQDAALKHHAAFVLHEFDAYKETLSEKMEAKYKAPELTDALKKAREDNLKANHKYEVASSDLKENEGTLTTKETIGEAIKFYTLKLVKTDKGWLVDEFAEQKAPQETEKK